MLTEKSKEELLFEIEKLEFQLAQTEQQKGIDQFPNGNVPEDRIERQEILEQIQEKADLIWEELDQKFFTYEDDLNKLNIEFIRKNKNKF